MCMCVCVCVCVHACVHVCVLKYISIKAKLSEEWISLTILSLLPCLVQENGVWIQGRTCWKCTASTPLPTGWSNREIAPIYNECMTTNTIGRQRPTIWGLFLSISLSLLSWHFPWHVNSTMFHTHCLILLSTHAHACCTYWTMSQVYIKPCYLTLNLWLQLYIRYWESVCPDACVCIMSTNLYLKDLCAARCIHAAESGNCTTRGIGTDVTCQWLFRPNLGSSSVMDEDPRLGQNVW